MKSIYRKYFMTMALIWAGCSVPLLFAYMLVLAPQKNIKNQMDVQLAEKKRIYNSAQKATQEETKAKLNEQIEHLQDKLKDFVIDFEDSANLTFDISRIAKEKKVTSLSVKSKESIVGTEIPGCKYISESHIDISFTADFDQFAALLNALERHRPTVFVDRFIINHSSQNDSNPGHQVSASLTIFVRKHQDG